MEMNDGNSKHEFCAEYNHLGEFVEKTKNKYKIRGIWLISPKMVFMESPKLWESNGFQIVAYLHEFGHMNLMNYDFNILFKTP